MRRIEGLATGDNLKTDAPTLLARAGEAIE
jgi:hypothetical protein